MYLFSNYMYLHLLSKAYSICWNKSKQYRLSILKVRYQLQVMYLYKKRVDMMQKLIMRIYSFSCDLECRVSSCLTDTQSWTRTRSRIYVSSVECTIGMLLNGAKDSPSHIRMHLCRVFISLVYYENKGIYNTLIQWLRIIPCI